jgi:hydroxymethylglutaryl-CoA synthase
LAPLSTADITFDLEAVSIAALSYYAPNLALKASSAEAFHVSPGRYTMGRGQENITFVSDDEDTVSLALSSLSRLLR